MMINTVFKKIIKAKRKIELKIKTAKKIKKVESLVIFKKRHLNQLKKKTLTIINNLVNIVFKKDFETSFFEFF